MRRLISWLLLIPIAALVAAFAVANRGPVSVDLDPLPFSYGVPLYGVVLGAVAVGFFWGGLSAWISAGKARRLARRRRLQVESAERDLKNLREKISKMEEQAARMKPASNALPPPADAA